jgi:hypothetical protein
LAIEERLTKRVPRLVGANVLRPARRGGDAMATRTRSDAKRESQPQKGEQEIAVSPTDIYIPDNVPDILIDGISGISVINGIVRLNCFSVQQTSPSEQKPRLVARLILSADTLATIHTGMTKVLAEFEENGLISRS